MMLRRAALLLFAAGCARLDVAHGPGLQAIEPKGAYQGQAVRVRITGAGLQPRGVQHLGGGGDVSTQFAVRIGGVALSAVQYLGDETGHDVLEALVPADLPVGTHDLEVVDPYGMTSLLRGAFTETDLGPPQLSAAIEAPARMEAGVPFTARLRVDNTGGIAARVRSATLGGAATTADVTVPAGGSAWLDFPAVVAQPGPAGLGAQASSIDELTGLPLEDVAAQATVIGLAPPDVSVLVGPAPAAVDVGQTFALTVTVQNAGEVDAVAVAPVLSPDPSFAALAVAPQDVPAGEQRDFVLPLQGQLPGLAVAQVGAAGNDPFTAATVTAAPAPSAPIAVQRPSDLRVVTVSAPAVVSLGQRFPVQLVVENAGDAVALAVSDASPGSASSSIVTPPAPRDVAGHAQAIFDWTMQADATGAAQVSAGVAGSDGNTLAMTGASSSAPVQIQVPASLSVQLSVPPRLSTGQTFLVTERIANSGDAAAVALSLPAPDCGAATTLQSSPALPASIDGHASATIAWGFMATAAGPLSCSASAHGADANSGAAVQATGSVSGSVAAAAALSIAAVTLPSPLSRGQTIAAQVTVHNSGVAGATGVAPALAVASGSAAVAPAPASQDIAGGASATFTFSLTENGTAPGTLTVQASAAGQDEYAGTAVSAAPVTSAPATVQQPAALRIDAVTLPPQLSRGQSFNLSVTVTNTGQATASAVTPSFSIVRSGGADLAVNASPAARSIAGGASATFTWSCTESGTGTGTLSITGSASGADANTNVPISATAAPVTSAVQTPSSLSVTVDVQTGLSRGQSFTLTARVTNSGGAIARGVQPGAPLVTATGGAAALIGSAPGAADIAPGATVGFTFAATENGTGTGTLSFRIDASGTDANSGTTVTGSGTSANIPVMTPASLSITSFTATPSTIDRAQAFTVAATVTNTGQAGAAGVTVGLSQSASGAHASTSSAPGPVGLAGGASATFTWNFVEDGSAAGSISFSATASGADANSAAALTSPAASCGVTVQKPATLGAAFALPASLSAGDRFAATLTVTNSGGAAANSVQPGTLVPSGTASIAIVSTPSPASATIAGGGNATFTWALIATGSGTLQLDVAVSGVDANNGALRTASATAVQSIAAQPESTQLSADPFSGDGTSFSYLFSYQGMVYVGPNKSGSGAVRMAPDGTGAVPINWTVEVDGNVLNPARNLAYQPPFLAPVCHTLGALNCNLNTTACGPDNEEGRAVFASGTIGTTEWYLVSAASQLGGSRYLYMTNGNFPLASGGYDDLAFEQIQAGQAGSTRMMTSTLFFQNQVFLGFLDSSGGAPGANAPVLNALVTTPSLPGSIAGLNTDLVNLQGQNLPAVGSKAGNNKTWVMIDSMRAFNGSLYVANNGGIARSVGAPTPCASVGCANWANATPTASPYGAVGSVTVDGAVLGTLDPSQRAIPRMVAFGGRLFAARNTSGGPQLWSCNPALGTDPQQCEPGDWAMVAPNLTGDPKYTQLNDGGNKAITLLVATASHLYVGYNNNGGIQIYRTANPAAAAVSDFTGKQGCTAGAGGCVGLGGNGLSGSLTRVFDAHAFTYSGLEWVYLAAGTGTSAPAIYRLAP